MAFFFFTGALASVTRTFVNPYSGYFYSINGEYSMNDSTYFGTSGEVDLLLMGEDSEILLLEDDFGNRVLNHLDQIIGSNGNDIINLASALYTLGDIGYINGDDGDDLIWSNVGNDYIYGGSGNDIIDGGGGNDVIIGGTGADYLSGGAGIDTVDYSLSDVSTPAVLAVTIDLVTGTGIGGDAQGDILVGIENITGTNQATQRDTIYGNHANNIILGMAGDDILEGGGGADTINGGDGWDYARYTRSASGVNVNLKTNVNTGGDAQGDLIYNVEAVVGSAYNDVIVGGDGKDYLKGEDGDDTLNGGLGTDQLFGGQGNDTYIYAAGRDTAHETGYGADRIIFDSTWQPQNAVITNNLITFVAGVHEVIFNNITLVESFSFTGYADMTLGQLVAFSQGATDVGTTGNDTLIGTAATQRFDGLAGNDTVDYTNSVSAVTVDLLAGSGSGGYAAGDTYVSIENVTGSNGASLRDYLYGNNDNNTLYGLAGDDFLEGGGGADIIDGGAGWDYARYTRSDSGIYINLETGVNMGGHAAGDVLLNIEAVVASNHNDMLRGGTGNDQLQGGNGNDIMTGGLGRDLLYGGGGADIFVFEADKTYDRIDMIRDFSITQGDVLNITDLLDGFDLMNDDIADFVQLVANGGNTDVRINADGDTGGAFTTAFTVEHGITQSLTDLLSNGNLVVDQTVVI